MPPRCSGNEWCSPCDGGWRWKKKTPDSGLLTVVEGHLSVGGNRGPANATVETESAEYELPETVPEL